MYQLKTPLDVPANIPSLYTDSIKLYTGLYKANFNKPTGQLFQFKFVSILKTSREHLQWFTNIQKTDLIM